jgi:group I intron endonuclease
MDTYKATNTLNGKFYIGSSNNFERRKSEHLSSKANYPFQNALRKNPDAFEWEVQSDDYDEPILEQALLDMWFGCGQCYNLSSIAGQPSGTTGTIWWKNELLQKETACFEKPGGEGWEPGRLQKTKEKQSEAKSGEETKKKLSEAMSGEKNPMFGVLHTKETKKKLSEAMSGENNPQFGKFGASNPSSKAIIAIKPDGTELHFGSGKEAAKELGINQGSLSGQYLKTGKSLTQGKFKGWQFIYKDTEVT